MDNFLGMFIVATITYGIYKLFELFVRRKERMTIIEKLSSGFDPKVLEKESYFPIFSKTNDSWAIKIGLLLIGVGLGVTIAAVVDMLTITQWEDPEGYLRHSSLGSVEVLYPACSAIFGGLGLVIAYFLEKKQEKKQ